MTDLFVRSAQTSFVVLSLNLNLSSEVTGRTHKGMAAILDEMYRLSADWQREKVRPSYIESIDT